MKNIIASVIEQIDQKKNMLSKKTVTVGFDGFYDQITRPIKHYTDENGPVFFQGIEELGQYITSKKNKSCSIELFETTKKIGGNAPIYANALGTLGLSVNLIGSLGDPVIHSVFNDVSDNCDLYSFADVGRATALEFDDGKIMMFPTFKLSGDPWEKIKQTIGLKKMRRFVADSDMLTIVNWSEVEHTEMILNAIIQEVMPKYENDISKYVLIDLSDCSKKKDDDILRIMKIIGGLNGWRKTVLGLNENEALSVYAAFSGKNSADLGEMCAYIYEKLNVNTLVIHTTDQCIAYSGEGLFSAKTFFFESPTISTGGGDNFNAGLTAALLMGLKEEHALVCANAVASFYVKHGYSPSLNELHAHLELWSKNI